MAGEGWSNFWDLAVALAWPGALAVGLYVLRKPLRTLIEAIAHKLSSAESIKVGNVELKGPIVSPKAPEIALSGNDYEVRPASLDDSRRREHTYAQTRRLMLVHRIRPSSREGQKFDVSIYFERKNSESNPPAEFDDVSHVEYYLGSYFGAAKHGAWFVVKTPKDGFAISTSAFGQALCVARIHFRDGEIVETSRFLDFQMAAAFPKPKDSND